MMLYSVRSTASKRDRELLKTVFSEVMDQRRISPLLALIGNTQINIHLHVLNICRIILYLYAVASCFAETNLKPSLTTVV